MDRVDSFRISEADFAKWENRCKCLKTESANAESHGTLIGPMNEMRDLRYLTQIYLESQRLAILHTICLGAHKWEMHAS